MKITFILPGIFLSGGIKSTLELANQLHSRGHNVSVVYPFIPLRKKWYHPNTCANITLSTLVNIKNGNEVKWFDLNTSLIRPFILSERWIPKGDIVVATNWVNAFQVNKYNSDKGKKFYFIRHYETWDEYPDLVKQTYDLPLPKIVTSNWLKKIIETEHNDFPIHGPIPNGVNLNQFYMESDDFDRFEPTRIGMLYRRQGFKCIKDGVKALKIVKEHCPDIKLVLFGEPVKNNELKALKELGGFEYHLLPVKNELREIYNSLDIFLFPSCSEGFGNPPMEAMACGAAVVSTNVGAVPDYSLNGKNILISSPHNHEALAKNVIELVENENKRKKIAKNGFNYIKNFTWEDSAKKLEKIFESCL